jgi:hypothetical protein
MENWMPDMMDHHLLQLTQWVVMVELSLSLQVAIDDTKCPLPLRHLHSVYLLALQKQTAVVAKSGAVMDLQINQTCTCSQILYEMLLESSLTVILVTASVKEDERGGQGDTSTSLLHQSAT